MGVLWVCFGCALGVLWVCFGCALGVPLSVEPEMGRMPSGGEEMGCDSERGGNAIKRTLDAKAWVPGSRCWVN